MLLRRGAEERRVAVLSVRAKPPDAVMKLDGVDSPEKAQGLRGFEIWVPRSEAAPLEVGEFYAVDLCRCSLYFGQERLGSIRSVVDAGASQMLEVEGPGRKGVPGAVHRPLRRRGGRAGRQDRAAGPRDRAVTFTVLTLFPGLFEGFLGSSILARAIERGRVTVRCVDIRDYATDRHHVCDDAAYGGGPGMVMKPEPIAAALEAVARRARPGSGSCT